MNQPERVPKRPHVRDIERLRRVRDRFGAAVREREVDHDHDHLTSTRREHVPVRTFYLGEIWWAGRYALGQRRPHREGSSHLPALVTRREQRPYEPVEMAPSSRFAPEDIDELCFRATAPPEGLQEETWFLLPYRRPVPRSSISAPLGKVAGVDLQKLAADMNYLRRNVPHRD